MQYDDNDKCACISVDVEPDETCMLREGGEAGCVSHQNTP